MQRSKQWMAAIAIILAVSGGSWFVSSVENEQIKVTESASSPWARLSSDPLPEVPVAQQASSQPTPSSPIQETRTQMIDRLLVSSNPADRLDGYKAVLKCVRAQRDVADLAKTLPAQAGSLYQEMQATCDGVTNVQMSQRFNVIAALAKSRYPGAAQLYIGETADGTTLNKARKDPNYQQWYQEALSLLTDSANHGDIDAIQIAAGILYQEPGRYQDFLTYKIASIEASRLSSPRNQVQLEGAMVGLIKSSEQSLSREQIEQAVRDGKALGRLTQKQ